MREVEEAVAEVREGLGDAGGWASNGQFARVMTAWSRMACL
jgi:hypothetical protein